MTPGLQRILKKSRVCWPNDISIGSTIFAHLGHSIDLYSMWLCALLVIVDHSFIGYVLLTCGDMEFAKAQIFIGSIFPMLKGFTRGPTSNLYHKTSKPRRWKSHSTMKIWFTIWQWESRGSWKSHESAGQTTSRSVLDRLRRFCTPPAHGWCQWIIL